jgi:hypothetical protein
MQHQADVPQHDNVDVDGSGVSINPNTHAALTLTCTVVGGTFVAASCRCITLLCCAVLQRVVSSFTYNLDHRTEPHYDTDKTRPYAAIMVRQVHLDAEA